MAPTTRLVRLARSTAVAIGASLALCGVAAATPGSPGAVAPSGFTALDPCPTSAPCPPKVTVTWGPASFGTGLLHRRYVLEPLAPDTGLGAAREIGATGLTLDVPQPTDGRLFRFRLFGRETELQLRDPILEVPQVIPIRPTVIEGLRPIVSGPLPVPTTTVAISHQLSPALPIGAAPIAPLLPIAPIFPVIPAGPDGPSVVGEFRIDALAPTSALTQSATHVGIGEAVRLDAAASTDSATSGSASGIDPSGFEWSFGDGTSGSGPAVEHRYAAPGTYAGELLVRDRVGNVARSAFGVVVSAVATDGAAVATLPRGGAKTTTVARAASVRGAAALRALGVKLGRPRLRATWRESRLRGRLILTGRAARPLTLGLRLRARGLAPRRAGTLRLRRGRFRVHVRLPSGLAPGALTLELRRGSRVAGRVALRLPAPPEGVVARAFAARSQRGAPRTRLPRGSRAIFARFLLASLPARGRELTITWYQPNGDVAGHPVRKARRRALASFVRGADALPRGRWRAVLRAADVQLAQVVVRVT